MQEKEITIYDLAKIVNVSATTVSRALNGHPAISENTKRKVRALAVELGYQPNRFASDLRRKNTRSIGVLVHELNTHFMTSVLSGIEQVATASLYDLVIYNSAESAVREAENAAHLFNKRVDGVIASLSGDTDCLSHFDVFFKKKIPVVFFDRVEMDSPGVKIVINNRKAGYDAGMHLIQLGCRNMMHIAGNLKRNVYAERWMGFQDALSQFGLPVRNDQLLICDFSEKHCLKAAEQIIQRKKLPDGIFIADDLCAAICLQRFKEFGIKIPENIAMIGFNNDITSRIVMPQLTTFHYPSREMGARAAECLIDQLNYGSSGIDSYTIGLKSEMLVRASTARTA